MVSHAGTVHANCAAALRAHVPAAEYVQVDTDDDQSYARLIGERWTGRDDLVLIEHDNEVTAEVLPSFAACPQPWCTYEYEIFPPPWTRWCDTGLGCARFTAALQREFDFAAEILKACGSCGGTHVHWGTVDVQLAAGLASRHLSPHVHGRIRHFHPYRALEPDANGEFPAFGPLLEEVNGEFRRVTG
jgi:hypothetical protein